MGRSAETYERPPGRRLGARQFPAILLLLCLQGVGGCGAREPAYVSQPAPQSGEPLELSLAPDAGAAVLLESPGGEYLVIEVAQQAEAGGVDVVVELVDPHGRSRRTIDGAAGLLLPEKLAFVADTAGTWRIRLSAKGAGHAVLTVVERRPAAAGDEARARAVVLDSLADHEGELESTLGLRAAEELLEQANPLWLEAGDQAGYARSLNKRGLCAQLLDRHDEAIEWFDRSRTAWETAGDPVEVTRVLYNEAVSQRRRGRPDIALATLADTLERSRSLGRRDLEYRALNSQGLARCETGSLEGGIESLEEARRLARESGAARSEAYATHNLGICLRISGDLAGAETLYEASVEEARELGSRELLAAALGHLGLVHQLRGEMQPALDRTFEALALRRELGAPLDTADTLANLGTLYLDLGRLDRAEACYREMLDLYRSVQDRRRESWAIRNLGWIRLLGGDSPGALARFAEARQLSDPALDPQGWAATVHAEGVAQQRAGEPEAARRTLEEAIAAARDAGDPSRAAAASVDLADVLLTLGQVSAARETARGAAELAARIGQRGIEAAAASRLAAVERAAGRPQEALSAVDRALELAEGVRSSVSDLGLRATYLAGRRRDFETRVDLLLELSRAAGGDPSLVTQALLTAERGKARSLADQLHEGHLDLPVPDPLARRRALLDTRWSAIQGRLVAFEAGRADAGVQPAVLREQLAGLEVERERLDAEIRGAATGGELLHPAPPDAQEIRAALGSGTLLLDYLVGDESTVVFAVTSERTEAYRVEIGAEEIGARVEAFRSALATPDRRRLAAALPGAHDLFARLLAPAGELLQAAERLVIAPDRALHALPFEALPTEPAATWRPGAEPWLVRRWAVTTAPSATVLAQLASAPVTRRRGLDLLVLADPVYPEEPAAPGGTREALEPEEPASRLPRLAASEGEAQAIAGLFPPARVALHLREEAREDRLRAGGEASEARFVHLAAHGLLDEDRPELQGLAFSADPKGVDDGLLQIHEILRLDLDADLVVLSACSTGLGREVRGEGLVGLTQSFLAAGARGVVVSLWPVDDRSTADLMASLYAGLSDGLGAADALRRAQLEIVAGGGNRAHPYYWAPFIVVAGTGPGDSTVH